MVPQIKKNVSILEFVAEPAPVVTPVVTPVTEPVVKKIDCVKNLCINPRPIIITMSYILAAVAVAGLLYSILKFLISMKSDKVTNTDKDLDTYVETENPLNSDRKLLYPKVNIVGAPDGISPRIYYKENE